VRAGAEKKEAASAGPFLTLLKPNELEPESPLGPLRQDDEIDLRNPSSHASSAFEVASFLANPDIPQ